MQADKQLLGFSVMVPLLQRLYALKNYQEKTTLWKRGTKSRKQSHCWHLRHCEQPAFNKAWERTREDWMESHNHSLKWGEGDERMRKLDDDCLFSWNYSSTMPARTGESSRKGPSQSSCIRTNTTAFHCHGKWRVPFFFLLLFSSLSLPLQQK